ncbi:hypothetical protein GW17_00048877 [Ensete ventricosum]|nr:hypothetical protein GW17_00048877 [Ensete ventricosum]
MSFRSYLRWICVNQSNAKHAITSWSLFLLGVFVATVSHFILSYAPHPGYVRHDGLALPHLYLRPLLPLPFRLRLSLWPQPLPLPPQDRFF